MERTLLKHVAVAWTFVAVLFICATLAERALWMLIPLGFSVSAALVTWCDLIAFRKQETDHG